MLILFSIWCIVYFSIKELLFKGEEPGIKGTEHLVSFELYFAKTFRTAQLNILMVLTMLRAGDLRKALIGQIKLKEAEFLCHPLFRAPSNKEYSSDPLFRSAFNSVQLFEKSQRIQWKRHFNSERYHIGPKNNFDWLWRAEERRRRNFHFFWFTE